MLTILLFILGLYFLLIKQYSKAITIIVVLASSYLQMHIAEDSGILRIPRLNISDFGAVLYIIFFFIVVKNHGVKWTGKLQNPVSIFLLFLIANGIYDCFLGTTISDVVRYLRNWMYLTIIYIYPYISIKVTMKSFRQVYYITLFICLILFICSCFGIRLSLFRFVYNRGIKPPSFSMIFAFAAFVNIFKMPIKTRVIHFFIFIAQSIIILKMTYTISILLMCVIYILIQTKLSIPKKIFFYATLCFIIIIFADLNTRFSERFISMSSNIEFNGGEEEKTDNNLNYRLFHATERLKYIMNGPNSFIRGIGYVQEKNFNTDVFYYGTHKKSGAENVSQLDTADIAWSLFFIRLGMVGLSLYLFFYCRTIAEYKQRKNKESYFMFTIMLVFLCFTSFGNAIIARSDFFIYPFLLLKKSAITVSSNKTINYKKK